MENEKICKICSQQTELFLTSRCFAPIMAHAPLRSALTAANLCWYNCTVCLVTLCGVTLLLYQCVQLFIHLSQLPFQGRKFRDDITKTTFRSYPISRSSIITQAISSMLRFSLWNRPHKGLGDSKGLMQFWVKGKAS